MPVSGYAGSVPDAHVDQGGQDRGDSMQVGKV